jgi:DNA-binding LacI/PurR family transcriptional regulator
MARQRTTLKQVAARAGVSVTTVSLVLNDAPASIGNATRKRVLAVAGELGYVPSAAARSLASGRTHTVGLIICHAEHLIVDAFIPQTLFGMNQVAREHGFRVLVEAVEDVTRPDAYHELVRAKQIDGLIVLNPRRDDLRLPQLVNDDYPLVTLGTIPGCDPVRVHTDNHGLAQRATEHLLALGHRRVGHVTFAPSAYLATDERLRGFRAALTAAGLESDDRDVGVGAFSAASGAAAARALLDARPDLTALFCGNDTVAIGVLHALAERGLRVPDDVALVGYDDIPTARYQSPPLTTVRSPAVAHGQRAMELVIDMIEGRPITERAVLLEGTLVVRRSCGAAAELRTPELDAVATTDTERLLLDASGSDAARPQGRTAAAR